MNCTRARYVLRSEPFSGRIASVDPEMTDLARWSRRRQNEYVFCAFDHRWLRPEEGSVRLPSTLTAVSQKARNESVRFSSDLCIGTRVHDSDADAGKGKIGGTGVISDPAAPPSCSVCGCVGVCGRVGVCHGGHDAAAVISPLGSACCFTACCRAVRLMQPSTTLASPIGTTGGATGKSMMRIWAGNLLCSGSMAHSALAAA